MGKKPFYLSRSVWGIAIMALGFYSPKAAQLLGANLDEIFNLVSQGATFFGGTLALYGRWKATQPLTASKVAKPSQQ